MLQERRKCTVIIDAKMLIWSVDSGGNQKYKLEIEARQALPWKVHVRGILPSHFSHSPSMCQSSATCNLFYRPWHAVLSCYTSRLSATIFLGSHVQWMLHMHILGAIQHYFYQYTYMTYTWFGWVLLVGDFGYTLSHRCLPFGLEICGQQPPGKIVSRNDSKHNKRTWKRNL